MLHMRLPWHLTSHHRRRWSLLHLVPFFWPPDSWSSGECFSAPPPAEMSSSVRPFEEGEDEEQWRWRTRKGCIWIELNYCVQSCLSQLSQNSTHSELRRTWVTDVVWTSSSQLVWCSGSQLFWTSGSQLVWCSGSQLVWTSGSQLVWLEPTITTEWQTETHIV